jgi:integrase
LVYGNGLVVVRESKFGKSRELPLHPSTLDALRRYLRRPDRPRPGAATPCRARAASASRGGCRTNAGGPNLDDFREGGSTGAAAGLRLPPQ